LKRAIEQPEKREEKRGGKTTREKLGVLIIALFFFSLPGIRRLPIWITDCDEACLCADGVPAALTE
jgi:hypothetical protein